MFKPLYFLVFVLAFVNIIKAQSHWESPIYGYQIEVPNGFERTEAIGVNVDFKAVNGVNSIVIVIKTIPADYAKYSIWELLGDLKTFGSDWQNGAQEYMNNPKFLKYGKTIVDDNEAFWYDYITDNPMLYSKVYQTQKGNKLYTVTLTCKKESYNYFSPIWYRFKELIKL